MCRSRLHLSHSHTLRDGHGHTHHAVRSHQEEEGLVSIELQAPSNYLDELAHIHVIRYKELGLVQDWQINYFYLSCFLSVHFLMAIVMKLGRLPSLLNFLLVKWE